MYYAERKHAEKAINQGIMENKFDIPVTLNKKFTYQRSE